jgi:hypothetical protein
VVAVVARLLSAAMVSVHAQSVTAVLVFLRRSLVRL